MVFNGGEGGDVRPRANPGWELARKNPRARDAWFTQFIPKLRFSLTLFFKQSREGQL